MFTLSKGKKKITLKNIGEFKSKLKKIARAK